MPEEPSYMFDQAGARRIVDAVRWVESVGPQRRTPQELWSPRTASGSFVWVRVSSSASLATNRWTYTCLEQTMTDTGWEDGSISYTPCYNGAEAYNDGTGLQGNDIDIDGADFPAGMSLQAISIKPVFQLYAGKMTGAGVQTWRFFVRNSVDGTCEEA